MTNDKDFVDDLKDKIKDFIHNDVMNFIETKDLSSDIGALNCTHTSWEHDYDCIELTAVSLTDVCTINFKFKLLGELDAEKSFTSDKIEGSAKAVIDSNGEVNYSDIIAHIIDEKPDEDDE